MASFDLRSNVKATEMLAPAAHTSDQNGTAVDMQGFESLMVVASVGAEGDTLSGSVYIQLEMEHSDDNSTFVDCAATDLVGEVGASGIWCTINIAAEASQVYSVSYVGEKRYVRAVVNLVGTHSSGTPLGLIALQGHAADAPVSQTANV